MTHKVDVLGNESVDALVKALTVGAPEAKVTRHVDLSLRSFWKIGGYADASFEPSSPEDIIVALRVARELGVPVTTVGNTSNLLFDSRGLRGVLLVVGEHMSGIQVADDVLTAYAGAETTDVVLTAARAGLEGIGHAAGIPGTIGGLVWMNGGTNRRSIGTAVEGVEVVETGGVVRKLSREDLQFGRRVSSLQASKGILVSVRLRLARGNRAALLDEIASNLTARAEKFPLELPSGGSTFVSDPRFYESYGPPGKIIEQMGLKGVSVGSARISEKHANFIVNEGGATDNDVLSLIHLIRERVAALTGHELACEVRHVSSDGQITAAHEVALSRFSARNAEEE